MKTPPLILLFSTILLAQTEFYFTTNTVPNPIPCPATKVTGLVECSLSSIIIIAGKVWNPDSLEWCTTKEGYYRSIDIAHPPLWKIDGNDLGTGFNLGIPVLDTLEHIASATYLDFPPATLHYKAVHDKLPYLIYSGNQKLFSSDSIHLFIESAFPLAYVDSTSIRTFRDDSIRIDTTILTYNLPSDTSIKLTGFLCNARDFRATYSPTLNSYSILIPLNDIIYLAKRHNAGYSTMDTSYDTISAVFRKQMDYDTVKIQFISFIYSGNIEYGLNTVTDKRFHRRNIERTEGVFDLSGRLVGKYSNTLSKGIYLLKTNGNIQVLPINVHREAHGELVEP